MIAGDVGGLLGTSAKVILAISELKVVSFVKTLTYILKSDPD